MIDRGFGDKMAVKTFTQAWYQITKGVEKTLSKISHKQVENMINMLLWAKYKHILIIGVGFIAIYRWMKTKPNERFTISLEISLPKSENKLDKALTIILALSIIIAATSLVYAIITPKAGEKFTELYILGPEGIADEYPKNLTIGEDV